MKMTDIDIDVPNKKVIDDLGLPHYKASMVNDDVIKEHNCGVYFQKVPTLFDTNLSTIPYEEAPKYGYFKIDILTNSVYENVKDEDDINMLLQMEPDWSLLEVQENVEKLTQIHNHYDTIMLWKPKSVEELAMLLAMIRPSKRHLITCGSWNKVRETIWDKPENDMPYFKKPHAIAYAHSIKIQLNLIKLGRV
jgi:hypothetical protein